MELTVVGWFVRPIISKLITELVDCAKDYRKKLGLKEDELARLKKQLPKMEAVVKAVDDQGLIREKNPPLDEWLWQLRDAADQAEDVMDEMEYHLAKEKVEGKRNKVSKAISDSNVRSFLEGVGYNDPTLKRLKKVVKEIDEVAAGTEKFHMLVKDLDKKQSEVVESVMSNRQTSSVLKVCVFGREKEQKNIITKLLNPVFRNKDVNYAVLPLVGAGGIGKTTLAQWVYNDDDVKKHFGLRIWVCVSNNFDKVLLTKKLYESAFGLGANFVNLDVMHTELEGKLKSERFLVVFDDVWDDNDWSGWEDLFGLFTSGKSGSMILLTTRGERVVTLMNAPNLMDSVFLEGLDKDAMWDLFKECAFGKAEPRHHKQLVEIGREIVNQKLRSGSPLAAKTIGAILRINKFNEEHWTSVLNSELWNLPQGPNDIMPALKLTYQYLPSHLKPCFSFCSIFPRDHVFIKDDLIYMWIALGLVTREENPEDVGSKYFEEMLDRSIFSLANPVSITHLCYPAYTYCSETEKQFVQGYIMHDLMHDLSAYVSQGECFRCDIDKLKSVPTTVRHLFIHVGDCREFKLSKPFTNVRTLILQFNDSNNPNQDCVNELLKEMKNLRVLTLFALTMSEVPKSVSYQLHLRYLSLSSYMLAVFPQSMSRLYLLETLVCGGYGSEGQADVLVKLINMRHLIASESFVHMIANIGKLTSLQELSFRVGRERGFEICQLRDMRELRKLSISNINDVDIHKKTIEAKLKDKHSLRKMSLQWNISEFDKKVLDKLELPFGLKELIIKDYPGGRPLVWWEDQSSTSESLPLALEKLTISNCEELELPYGYLNKFSSLRKLDIIGCPKINPFVVVLFLPLQSICINGTYVDLNADGPHELSLQPSLQTEGAFLYVIECPDSYLVRFLRMRDHYTGIWPPNWFTQNLSMLEHLSIDGRLPGSRRYYNNKYSSIDGRLPARPDDVMYSHELSNSVRSLLFLLVDDYYNRNFYQHVEMICALDMVECEQFYFSTHHLKQMQYLKKLTISPLSKSCVFPPLPLTLKELRLAHLGLQVIPSLYNNQNSELKGLPSLVALEIHECPNLVSLAEGLLQNPGQFPALKELTISDCEKLEFLPEGGFNRFISLQMLHIDRSPKFRGIPLLPLTLEKLSLSGFETDIIPNLNENPSRESGRLPSLVALEIYNCFNLVSLAKGLLQNPEQFPALKELTISGGTKLEYITEGFKNSVMFPEWYIDRNLKYRDIPVLPLTLEKLSLSKLPIDIIPYLYGNHSRESGGSLPLVALTIDFCPNLESLAQGLLQNPGQFPALKELTVSDCEELDFLPEGFFDRFISLRKLHIDGCSKLPRQLPRTTSMVTKTEQFGNGYGSDELKESIRKRREASEFWWFWNGDAIFTI